MKKEFNILNYFNMRALFMGIGLSRIISISHEYVWLTLILGTILGLILLYLFRIEMKKNILNILLNCVVISISLIIIINMISTMYLTKMPKFLIGLPLIILVMYMISKKEIVIFRVANILLVINLLLYTISFFALLKYFRFSNFYYTNVNFMKVLTSSVEYALYSVTPTLLLRKDKYKNISIYKTYFISSLTMAGLCILTYGILGCNLSSILRYPEYLILRQISLSSAIENIENIISFMWIIDIFMLIVTCSDSIKYNLNKPQLIHIILPLLLVVTTFLNTRYVFIILTYKFAAVFCGAIMLILWLVNKKLIFSKR